VVLWGHFRQFSLSQQFKKSPFHRHIFIFLGNISGCYVDRILRGAKPADLPVQLPTKLEMFVNRKTAAALGLAVPPSIMLRADEIIE
jgi:hypothetical protein